PEALRDWSPDVGSFDLSGNVTVTGPLTWTSGAMGGTGQTIVAASGTLTLSGSARSLGRVLENDGTASWTGGDLVMNGGTLDNRRSEERRVGEEWTCCWW